MMMMRRRSVEENSSVRMRRSILRGHDKLKGSSASNTCWRRISRMSWTIRDLSLLGFRPDIGMSLIFRILVTILLLFKLTSILARNPKDAAQDSVISAISTNLEVDPDQLRSSLASLHLSCSE